MARLGDKASLKKLLSKISSKKRSNASASLLLFFANVSILSFDSQH